VRIAYFDCFSGISGDMALGALVHAGADLQAICETLATLPIEEFSVEQEEVEVQDFSALRIHIKAGRPSVIRTYASIRQMLAEGDLPGEARRTAERIYRRLADAVAKVHGASVEFVTFHEFGELDCAVEIVGCALALHELGVERVFASPVPTGLGMVRTEHGAAPIPSPVVIELLQGAPTYSRGVPAELVTPTGAAILASISEGYGEMPMLLSDRVGYGAGGLRLDFPRVLRVVIGEEHTAGAQASGSAEPSALASGLAEHVLVEATMDASGVGAPERLLHELAAAGALDAWMTPAIGAGGQPRLIVSAVGPHALGGALAEVFRAAPGITQVRTSRVGLTPA
jgi:uncharacterized protein (TIGR00299 family) protein